MSLMVKKPSFHFAGSLSEPSTLSGPSDSYDLEIVLRTHNKSNIHSDSDGARYCKVSKTELMTKCVTSLIASMNACDKRLRLWILDDNSTQTWLEILNDHLIPKSKHPVELIRLPTVGFNASALAQFEKMAQCPGLVYSVEDDYLHEEGAIGELIQTWEHFSQSFSSMGRQIALFPFDMPDSYVPPWLAPCTVVHGPKRHWRTGVWTTNTMLIPGPKVREHWKWFELYATQFRTEWGMQNNIHEGTTIANIFREDVLLFSPIPSLALHMQFETQKDPYIDWRARWNSVPNWISDPV
jgi:hypothetical protein